MGNDMCGLISRQAAIDAMAELQGRAYTKAELKAISKAWKRIERLPSVQPDLQDKCDGCFYVNNHGACDFCMRNFPDRYSKEREYG